MAADERRKRLRRTYLKLGSGEIAASLVLLYFAGYLTPRLQNPLDAVALWSAVIPLLVVLVQAGVYWLRARAWVGRGVMPAELALLYRRLRIANVVLLALGLVGIIVCWPGNLAGALVVLAVWVFAVIEYLNYFVVRLAYPFGEWFTKVRQRRVPTLVQDATR